MPQVQTLVAFSFFEMEYNFLCFFFFMRKTRLTHTFFDESVGSMTGDGSDQVSFYKLIMTVIKLGERRPTKILPAFNHVVPKLKLDFNRWENGFEQLVT